MTARVPGSVRQHSEPRACPVAHALPIVRHGHQRLLEPILILRANFSAYDATYVSLAEVLEASVLTADDRLIRAVQTHTKLVTLPA
jgi:predicted nucleic acid-binding protein